MKMDALLLTYIMILHNVCKCKAEKSPKITSIALLRKTSAVEGSCLRKFH